MSNTVRADVDVRDPISRKLAIDHDRLDADLAAGRIDASAYAARSLALRAWADRRYATTRGRP